MFACFFNALFGFTSRIPFILPR